ncbi:NADPH:adrenodoxin oxidoreductase mitochondrial, partial [Bienertia sinuspersici]
MAIFRSRLWLSRAFSSLSSNLYALVRLVADLLMLKAHHEAEVDISDRLPNPFGLVRSGVTPDYLETKVGVCVLGNVNLGSSVSLKERRDVYHVVIF